jgi:hypothetical protein
MTGFIGLFDTACDYTFQFTITHRLVLWVCYCLHWPLLGSGFQRRTFPFPWVPNGSQPQLPSSNSNNSQRLSPSSSHQATNYATEWPISSQSHIATDSKSVCLGAEPHLGFITRYLLLFDIYSLVLWGTHSDQRTGLSFVYAAGPCQRITCSAYNISTRTTQKTPFHYYCVIVEVGTRLFEEQLLSNGCRIFASFAVVA